MIKPLGMMMGFDATGSPRLGVSGITEAEDKVWDAVDEAIAAGWTVEQFKREAAQAWEHVLREQQKHAAADWRKP